VGARQLGHRIVPIANEHALVELLGAADGDHVVGSRLAAGEPLETRVGLVDELVQEHPPKALLGARVAREEGSLDHLGQVSQGENGPVHVGEKPGQQG